MKKAIPENSFCLDPSKKVKCDKLLSTELFDINRCLVNAATDVIGSRSICLLGTHSVFLFIISVTIACLWAFCFLFSFL